MSFAGLLFIAFVGLIVFGPKKSVVIGKQIGDILAQLKRTNSQFQSQLLNELENSHANAAVLDGCESKSSDNSSHAIESERVYRSFGSQRYRRV